MLTVKPPGLSLETIVYGRAGELLQVFPDVHSRILVSGPITSRLYSSVEYSRENTAFPSPEEWKSMKAIELFYKKNPEAVFSTRRRNPGIRYFSTIPRGKGLGSSSADILSVLQFLDRYYETGLSRSEIYKMAAEIEPTDPLLSPGTVVFNSRTGDVIEELSPLPMAAIFFDAIPGRSVITPSSNELPLNPDGRSMLESFVKSWNEKKYEEVFRITTESAILNYEWNPRPGLLQLSELARFFGFGVFVAHTGTIIGALCETHRLEEVRALILNHLKSENAKNLTDERFV